MFFFCVQDKSWNSALLLLDDRPATLRDLRELEKHIDSKIGAAKRSILYDIRETKRSILNGLQNANAPLENADCPFSLPIKSMENFEDLEKTLEDTKAANQMVLLGYTHN